MTFCERLKDSREKKGFTSKFVAQQIGVAPSTYSQYETGSREPDVIKIQSISKLLQVSADYLLFGVEHPFDVDSEGIKLYKRLDELDKAEIRGTIKQMLKADKYNHNTQSSKPPVSVFDRAVDITDKLMAQIQTNKNQTQTVGHR